MYQEHFGLQRHLFEEGIAQGVDVFLGAAQKLAVTNLGVALTLRDSVAVLTGPAGVGKTTLAAHTLRSLTTRLALGWVGTVPATGHELLEMLLTEFGFTPYKNSRVERLQMWRQYLNEMRATDTRVCVLVESAENLQPEVLASLESLSAADPNGGPGANVVLTSRAGLALLDEPALAALKQRTRLRWSFGPLTRAELRDYLVHCITAAGGKTLKLFTDEAIDALHQYTGGIIRTANNLCATALTLAASAREPQVNAQLVTQVAVDVFGLSPLVLATTPAREQPTPARVEPRSAAPRAESPPPIVRPGPSTAPMRTEPTPAAVRPEPTSAAFRAEPTPPAPRVESPPPAVRAEPSPAATLRTEPTPAARPEPSPADAWAAALAPTLPPAAAPRTVASPPVVPTPTPTPAPAPSMAPSRSLAARVAATRAAQTAPAPAQRPAPVTKPASAPTTASSKPAMAQTSAAPPPAAPAPPAAAKAAPPTSTPATAAPRGTAPARTAPQVPPTPARPSAGAKPEPNVPVLTVEFESSPEIADEEFSFDLALSAGQIDAVLAKDLSDVPVLTDPIDSIGEQLASDDSMRIEFDEDTQHKLANLEALANAKALEDISNSMAETLFGDAELDKLAATLALASGKRDDKTKDDEPSRPTTARTAP